VKSALGQRYPTATRLFRRTLTITFVFAAIAIGGAAPAAAATRLDRSVERATPQTDLVALINAYRAGNGRQAVSPNSALTGAAAWMANDMAAKNYLSHVSSDGRSPTQRMTAFGYPAGSLYTGEDLGAGYGTANAVLAGWQASSVHNAVLLNPNYDAVGIGLAYNANSTYKWYWVADFGGAGGTVRVTLPAPPPQPVVVRAVAAPRASVPQPAEDTRPADETVDPEAAARAARIARIEAVGARRVAHLFVLLQRMGVI
jgi:uncharacterized protein YkwD